ncbi:response regulator [Blastopirellula marina]|uniref:Two-component system response regulator n=1 Tax=Blastopirellula marina TaxID=124 RepID=A0A2S8GCD4_9BACT|nr:response regulator [Blastopirellula marina]PQO41744.1 two-component system response regulator [Blastopirellula marina]PTL46187.1 response regulator [Blastopirellula marina]
MIREAIKILLVEDDDIDAEAVRRGFAKAELNCAIHRAINGIQALELLERSDSPFRRGSFIILLDLKMPGMNGLEFLRTLRQHEQLKRSIVFVLTTSNDEQDRGEAYAEGISGYVTKSHAGIAFQDLVGMLDHYAQIVEFPTCG